MPKIGEMLLKLEDSRYTTSLDLNMGYYHNLLSKNAIKLCTIILPWEKYRYKRLPTPKMNGLFRGFEFIRAYIYDILILTKLDWTDHVQKA